VIPASLGDHLRLCTLLNVHDGFAYGATPDDTETSTIKMLQTTAEKTDQVSSCGFVGLGNPMSYQEIKASLKGVKFGDPNAPTHVPMPRRPPQKL
jgi:hypothetical protein